MRFRLSGINNQNFLMRDDATGSWWQQSTGEAVLGPLRGQRLAPVAFDELTFGTWRAEHPEGRVLAPVAEVAAAERYARWDWEARMAHAPVVTPVVAEDAFAPRDLVVGLEHAGAARAFGLASLRERRVVRAEVGGTPVLLLASGDGRSVRAFVAPEGLVLVPEPGAWGEAFVDPISGSRWDFAGRAISGPAIGLQMERMPALVSYWFDWKQQHPGTDAALAP